jgi:hypothetical protein
MTKENFTSINVILDESGSMGGLLNDNLIGLNTLSHNTTRYRGGSPNQGFFLIQMSPHPRLLNHDNRNLCGQFRSNYDWTP